LRRYIKGEAEGMNKASVSQREELASRSTVLDRREREIREALSELREREDKVGRCRSTVSKPVLKARLISALETNM